MSRSASGPERRRNSHFARQSVAIRAGICLIFGLTGFELNILPRKCF